MDASNFTSFDPLTSLSSFPTYIIYPFDQPSPSQQSLSSITTDPLFASLNLENYESSDFSNPLGCSQGGYGSSFLNFATSPPNDISTRSKSPFSSYFYESNNFASIPTHMSFQSILDAIQSNLSTNTAESYNTKFDSVDSNTSNMTPIPSVYTLLKINKKDDSSPSKYSLNKEQYSMQLTDIYNDTINLANPMNEINQQSFHAYSKITLLKKKPVQPKHRKDSLSIFNHNICIPKVDKLANDNVKSNRFLKSNATFTKNESKINLSEGFSITGTALNEKKVVMIKNASSKPIVEIKDEQFIKIDGKNRWKCKICEKSYSVKHNLVTHMLGHDGIKPFSCTTCGRCFKQLSHLNTHILTHGAVKKHKCNVCNQAFLQSSHLKRHSKLHNKKSVSCTVCKKEFNEIADLNRHHDFEICIRVAAVKSDKPKKFLCETCDKAFLHLSQLLVHSNIHSNVKQFICTECGQEFNKDHHLKSHILTHSGLQPFSCAICSRKFSQKSNLIRHKMTHLLEKHYKCLICQQSFKNQQVLNVHAIKHRPNAPFKCQHCNKSFSRRHSLKAHINLHKDSKQHVCLCGAAFTLKCNLNRHQKEKNCNNKLKLGQKSTPLETDINSEDINKNESINWQDSSLQDQKDFHLLSIECEVDPVNKHTPKKKRKSMPRKTISHEPEANEVDEDATEAWKVTDKSQQSFDQPEKNVNTVASKLIVQFKFDDLRNSSNLLQITSSEKMLQDDINQSNIIVLTELQPL